MSIPRRLSSGAKRSNCRPNACYTDPREAFAAHRADFCTVVVPPNHHEAIVDVALAHRARHPVRKADRRHHGGLRSASSKKVKDAGRKMAVTMSHRFDQDKTTLRQIVRSGQLGKVNTVSCRYAADMREHMAWGALFRHTMLDPLMIEGAVHHLDLVADFAGRAVRDALQPPPGAGLGRICRRYRRHRDDEFRERRARSLRGFVERLLSD